MDHYSPNLRKRINILRWVFPLGFSVVATVYQLGIARWAHTILGENIHYVFEILFFGTAGPLLAFWVLTLIGQWFDERDQAEQKARLSEKSLAAITAMSVDAILSINPGGIIQSWNRGAELLFGYRENEILGQMLSTLFEGDSGASIESGWLLETVQRSGLLRGHQTKSRNALGEEITVELTATELRDEGDSVFGISIILRDITRRVQREKEIKELNASLNRQVAERTSELADKVDALALANAALQKHDQMRSEFVSLVSHQVRAPLTNLRGALERVQSGCGVINSTCLKMFVVMDQQIDRLNRLVKEVLNMARIESGNLALQLEPISIAPILQQVVEQTKARASDRVIQMTTKPGMPLVYADRDHIAEVLSNLLDNADKYSQPGALISVEMRADEFEVVLSVQDSGPGLPTADLPRLFDKFFRADSGDSQAVYGYGLGLYICRSLVEAQGGRIWAENHKNGGAIFAFSVPVWNGEND